MVAILGYSRNNTRSACGYNAENALIVCGRVRGGMTGTLGPVNFQHISRV